MLSCLDYLQNKANSPPSDCCSSFGNIVNVAPKCLCEAANGASQFQVNQTRVLSLPIVCNVDATKVADLCKNNTGGSSSGGSSSTKLSYFLSLPAILMYAIMSAVV
ncbi:hypothetical protein LIER_28588 [Lithospermum erythrorhizon]|uniref:Bifunctional inhibitor/plant lipid transfer protein/seed storage helical domain-containing protein n=1 Tax=Lithospermum erythrorhizon TaxID=34254 RepID=A0AAV3RJK7_LITER